MAATKVIVISGVEIRDTLQGVSLVQFLNDKADRDKKTGVWTYPKGPPAKAKFEVTHLFTAKDLAAALDTPDAYVVYSGHSRYGQGPAFGDSGMPHVPDKKKYPVNPWGVHFRMGYDATDTEAVGDLIGHSVTPVEYDLTATPAKAFLPATLVAATASVKRIEDKRKKGRLTADQKKNPCSIPGSWRAFDVCYAKLAKTATARGDTPLAGRHYYEYRPHYQRTEKVPDGRDDFFVSVTVGGSDLAAVSLKCKLFFMASCSSREHYYQPLKRRRKAAKSSCKFLLTEHINTASNARNFLEGLFKGYDPLTKAGATAMLKHLRGYKDNGNIDML